MSAITDVGILAIAGIGYLGYKEIKDMNKNREPVALVNQTNLALPTSNTNILAADISPTKKASWLVIQMSASIDGIFKAIVNGYPFVYDDGAVIPANSGRIYYLQVYGSDLVNFQFSGTGGVINNLSVTEIYKI